MKFLYHATMERRRDSHKGENGTIAVIGGSRHMHGAPIFSVLAAEACGADLTYAFVPACHEEVIKNATANVQVYPFANDELAENDVEHILELLAVMDCAVIGPGLKQCDDTEELIKELVHGAACPLVLDAMALHPFLLETPHRNTVIATPHLGELERMGLSDSDISDASKQSNISIFLKGAVDRLAFPDGSEEAISGGNAGLTVGGTGDALAGLIAGLLAQGLSPRDACVTAGRTIKAAGEALYTQKGYAYTARDVIHRIPFILNDL